MFSRAMLFIFVLEREWLLQARRTLFSRNPQSSRPIAVNSAPHRVKSERSRCCAALCLIQIHLFRSDKMRILAKTLAT
jgi:hypothetical protein